MERHSLIVAEAMEKTLKDEKCEQDIALTWAVSAKNAFQNHLGQNPNALFDWSIICIGSWNDQWDGKKKFKCLTYSFKRVNHKITNLKGIVSAYDNALFLWHDELVT